MTREAAKGAKSAGPRRRRQREAAPPKSPASAPTRATQPTLPSRKSRSAVPRSDTTDGRRKKSRPAVRRAVTQVPAPAFDTFRVAELIEACRAHVARLTTLAAISSRTLFECYEYDADEPELWQCCHLVRRVLKQTQAALIQLGIVSHDVELHVRAEEIAIGCEAQRQWLRPAVHVVRAIIHVLLDAKPDLHD